MSAPVALESLPENSSKLGAVDNLHVVLVEPEIHWNTGNAGRSCLAAGARLHLVEPLGFSLDDREVRRAGLDYWPRVRPRIWPDWDAFEAHLPQLGEPYLFSSEAPRDLWSVSYPERAVLIFGRESAGLPLSLRVRFGERLLAIPMADPELRSLNLSSSVAVALYEVIRQRRPAAAHR
ncbi:MAG TPA: tRNA (cytidine(34)-2'-O)-methyltransferase [Thermoanaerobaculia bacterium]|nr:tRNA (cytidine(34)-2'-O)-methyltransferase [Thermoanaerobaculia bacterium]